jgi:dTMP kinase
VVILDRYYLSTAAYQGARGADPEQILAENERFAPAPDLALLLDLAPAAGLSRVRTRGDVPNEFEREHALEEARRIFLSIQRPWLARIDAGQSPEAVAKECVSAFERARHAKAERA